MLVEKIGSPDFASLHPGYARQSYILTVILQTAILK
jgi:hypothetical protein